MGFGVQGLLFGVRVWKVSGLRSVGFHVRATVSLNILEGPFVVDIGVPLVVLFSLFSNPCPLIPWQTSACSSCGYWYKFPIIRGPICEFPL